jgi:hypothetical protein
VEAPATRDSSEERSFTRKVCTMKKWSVRILAVMLVVSTGVVTALAIARPKPVKAERGFICPITGQELPCPKCCPLNGGK